MQGETTNDVKLVFRNPSRPEGDFCQCQWETALRRNWKVDRWALSPMRDGYRTGEGHEATGNNGQPNSKVGTP